MLKKNDYRDNIEFSAMRKTSLSLKLTHLIEFITLNNEFRVVVGLFAAFLLLVFAIFIAEKSSNSRINTFFDAFWFSLVTITTVGYGDITPATIIGRVAGIVLLLFGVIAFAGISGKVASVLLDKQIKKDRGLVRLKKIMQHFIICGWQPNFDKILLGVLAANPDIPLDHIVLINTAPAEKMDIIKTDKRFKDILYVFGDYTDEATLLRANIHKAERTLLLADYSQDFSAMEIDSRTVLAVMTMEKLNARMYTAAEIIDTKFKQYLSASYCDEIILTKDYERSLLVSASSGMGLSHVLSELITETSGEGLIIRNISDEFIGKLYRDYRRSLSASGQVLVGLLENTGNFYFHKKEAIYEAENSENTQNILNNRKIKNLRCNCPVLTPPDEYIIKPYSRAIFICGKNRTNFTPDGTALEE